MDRDRNKKKIKSLLQLNKSGNNNIPKHMGHNQVQVSSMRKVHGTKCSHKTLERSYVNNKTILKSLEKQEETTPIKSRHGEIKLGLKSMK